jgi:chemotaxis protein MotC
MITRISIRALLLTAVVLAAHLPGFAYAAEETHAETKPGAETAVLAPRPAVLDDIRSLFALQDLVAAGHQNAAPLQKSLLAQINGKINEEILKSQPTLLAPAITGYVLSGGNPRIAEMLAETKGLEPRYRPLLKAAAFYTRGKHDDAESEFAKLGAFPLSPQIEGRVALARAMLAGGNEIDKQRFLTIAIAAMPGSLIEESALRRSALAYAEAGNEKAFWRRAERYVRRFPRSLYAREFMHELLTRIATFEAGGKNADLPRLDRLLGTMGIARRRELYLDLARQAALKNLAPLTAFGARRLRRISIPGSSESELASLYDSLFEIASERSEHSLQKLEAIDSGRLPLLERDLLAASIAVARLILDPIPETPPMPAIENRELEKSGLEKQAERALTLSDELMRETQ